MTERYLRKRPHLSLARQLVLGLAAGALGYFFLSHSRPAPPRHEPAASAVAPTPLRPAPDQPQTGSTALTWMLADQRELPLPGLTFDAESYTGQNEGGTDLVTPMPMLDKPVSAALPLEAEESAAAPKPSQPASEPHKAAKPHHPPASGSVPKPVSKQPISTPPVSTYSDEIKVITLTPASTLNQKKSSHLSVQLMGSSSLNAVEQFVVTNRLSGKVWVYRTQLGGNPWYVVLKGEHASLSQAQAAIGKLPPALLKAKPWPKSFADVKIELKR